MHCVCASLLPAQRGEGLLKQTEELDRQIQSNDELIRKMGEEAELRKQTADKKLEELDVISEVTTFTAARSAIFCMFIEFFFLRLWPQLKPAIGRLFQSAFFSPSATCGASIFIIISP